MFLDGVVVFELVLACVVLPCVLIQRPALSTLWICHLNGAVNDNDDAKSIARLPPAKRMTAAGLEPAILCDSCKADALTTGPRSLE